MKKYLYWLLSVLFFSCSPSGYQEFYQPLVDVTSLQDVERLKPNQEPQVFGTDNFDRDIYTLRSKNYHVIGYSSFNGSYEDISEIIKQAKKIGSTLVLTSSKYTNTLTSQIPLFIPQKSTTKYQGTFRDNKNNTIDFSGESITNGTNTVYATSNEMRYDQHAIYLIKSIKKLRFGVRVLELTREDRIAIRRNTGAKIGVVIEDSPCFYANLLPGDILIKIDDIEINNSEQALQIMQKYNKIKNCLFTILRDNNEIKINIELE